MRRCRFVAYPAFIALVVVLCAACGGSAGNAGPTEAPKPPQAPVETATPTATLDVERLSESIVMVAPGIYVGGDFEPIASGSGTIVDESGLILTNYHVVDPDLVGPYENIALYVAGSPEDVPDLTYFGGLAAWDDELDLAVIRITDNRNSIEIDPEALDLETVRTRDTDDLEIGGNLTVLGYPVIGEGSLELTKGYISGLLASEGLKQAWIKTDARIAAGNSGGGAFDERGYLVGVPTAVYYVEELGPETSGRIRPVDLALPLIEEARATTAVVIPSPGEVPEGDIPLLAAFDIGADFVLGEELYLTNEDRASWYLEPDSALDFYESHGRLGGARRVFDNLEAAETSGQAPFVVVIQVDLYETERGAADAASGCDEFLDTMWEFVTAVGFDFYEPEYLSDPLVGDESCMFGAEEIVASNDQPPVVLGFIGFRQSNVLALVAMLSLPDWISFEGLEYLAALQSNFLADELGLIVPPRQPANGLPVPQPPAAPAPARPSPPQPIGYWMAEDAIGAYWASYGLPYVGDCAFTNPNTDIGMYCSSLSEEYGSERVYLLGLTFSEADTLLLLGQQNDGSWLVTGEEPWGPIGYFSPEDAIGAYLADYGLWYAGDCAWTDPSTDIGMYCSILYEDRGFDLIYILGLTFSEADTWVLVGQYGDGSWLVIDEMPLSYDAWRDLLPPPW
jgi:S1-C subfamily serine protease